MSFASCAHCHRCHRAFDTSLHGSCPRCVGEQPAATLAQRAAEFSQWLAAASATELVDAQWAMRELGTPAALVMAEAIAQKRQQVTYPTKHVQAAPAEVAANSVAELGDWLRAVVIATLEAATLQLVAQVESARVLSHAQRSNVVKLFPAAAELDSARRWVAALAA